MKCKNIKYYQGFQKELWFSNPLSICLMTQICICTYLSAILQHSLQPWATHTCQARAGAGEEEVTHINSNNNYLKNLRNARDLGLVGTQHGSNEAKNIQLPSRLCFGIFFLHYSSFECLMGYSRPCSYPPQITNYF